MCIPMKFLILNGFLLLLSLKFRASVFIVYNLVLVLFELFKNEMHEYGLFAPAYTWKKIDKNSSLF